MEVLGIELRQYVGQGIKALVPRVIGQTEAAKEQKERSSPGTRTGASIVTTTAPAFLEAVGSEAAPFFSRVLEEATVRGLPVSFGGKGFSVRAPKRPVFFYCYPPGTTSRETSDIEIFLRDLADPALAAEIRERVTEVQGVKASGKYTLRMLVSSTTLAAADRLFQMSLEFMERQAKEA